jgi:2-acylglycerol O-acyltransferase 2
MSLFQASLPFSFAATIFVFLLGVSFTILIFGIISGVILIVCIYSGIINISPILEMFGNVIRYFNPGILESVSDNLRKSLLVEYPDGKPSNSKYIFLFHPHGMFSISMMFHIGTSITEWIPRPAKGVTASWLYWLPFGKELLPRVNAIPSDYSSMKSVLDNDESLCVSPGGIREIMYIEEGSMKLSIKNKRGVFRLALETGTPLIPVLSYGENELFDPVDSSWVKNLQNELIKYGLCFPIPSIKSLMEWLVIFWNPLKNPVHTVVGAPVEVGEARVPTDSEIIDLRDKYFVALRDLYRRTKPASYTNEISIV